MRQIKNNASIFLHLTAEALCSGLRQFVPGFPLSASLICKHDERQKAASSKFLMGGKFTLQLVSRLNTNKMSTYNSIYLLGF